MRHGLQHDVRREPRIAVCMNLQRPVAQNTLHSRNERRDALWREQPARIFQKYGIDTEADQILGFAYVIIVRVHRAVREHQPACHIHAVTLPGFDRDFEIAHVIERVIRRVIAHAVCNEALRRQLNDIVGKKFERKQALPARMNDERRLRDPGRQDTHPLPRIFAQVAHAHVEHCAADEIDRLEACPVETRRQLAHHARGHPRRPKALVRVTQRHIYQADRRAIRHWQNPSRPSGCALNHQ